MNGQISVFDSVSPAGGSAADSESFGCCHRFRQCSDAGRCLIPDLDYSSACSYRKNLEKGLIFYGKNAAGFSSARYAEFLRRADKLPPFVRAVFDSLVIDFCEYHRGTVRLIVRNEYISEISSVGLFEFRPIGADFPRLCDYRSFLRPKVDNVPAFKEAKAVRKAERKDLSDFIAAAKLRGDSAAAARLQEKLDVLYGEGTMDFMRWWLNHDGSFLRDILAAPYRAAFVSPDCAPYLEELYRDAYMTGVDSRIYHVSPLAFDGILSLYNCEEEELRRVKLSRGYSPDEKARRIEAIQTARSARAEARRKKSENAFHPV